MAAATTTVISFVILLMLNMKNYYFYGPFQMLHYLSFTYMLNGSFIILHGIVGDMDPTTKFLITYYGSGALMYLVSSFLSFSYLSSSHIITTAIAGLGVLQGVLMAALAIFVTLL
ncbi:uncharacterized protein LOC144094612 [Amblyomma americanum]